MALWHDPLDELIADLERTLPAVGNSIEDVVGPLAGCQRYVQAVLYGSAEEVARAEQDPLVQAWLAATERLAARVASQSARATGSLERPPVPRSV
jgi:hypothetical protein